MLGKLCRLGFDPKIDGLRRRKLPSAFERAAGSEGEIALRRRQISAMSQQESVIQRLQINTAVMTN